jgi:parallel beta-helix repeat protein
VGAETGIDRMVEPAVDGAKFGERSIGRAGPPRWRGGRRGRRFLPVVCFAVALASLLGVRAATLAAPEIRFVTSASTDCAATTVTRVAVADAWIADGLTSNKGSDGDLAVEANPLTGHSRALVRFTLPSAGIPEGCVVEKAVLRLYTSSGTDGAKVEALRLTSSWSESQVVWSNQPGAVGPAASAWSRDGYVQWNVTSQVETMFAGPDHGFQIRDPAEGSEEGGAGHGFESREKGENPPLLVIRFAAPPTGEAPPAPEPPAPTAVTCGQVVTTSIQLTANLTDCQDSGLVIGASNIVVDLDGRTIDGVGMGAGILNDGFSRVTIRNGTIQGFDHGVELLSETDLNLIESLTVQGNEIAAIELFEAWEGNEVRGSTLVGNGAGIALVSGTRGTVVTDNTMSGSSGAGLLLRDADDNVLARNGISGGGDLGVGLERATGNTLADNEVLSNSDGGIEIRYASHDNLVEGNFVSNSGDTGILVSESDGNHVISNTTRHLSDSGITLDSANDGVVRGNDVRLSPGGIEMSGSSRNLIEDNIASENTGNGIELGGDSFGNDVVLNVTNDNAAAGIYVEGEAIAEPGNIIDRNTALRNAADGIAVAKGGHVIVANVVRDNRAWGIYANGVNLDGLFNVATGNGQAAQCFGVVCKEDWVPPETEIESGPASPTNATTATFVFGGDDGITPSPELGFECRLDMGSFTTCSSPRTYSGLAAGEHVFEVRARDRSGLVDLSPASFTWTIDTTPPETTIESSPETLTREPGASFDFSSNEDGSAFECALDDGELTPCASPAEYALLDDGEHTFTVRATDEAGNTDPTPASSVWTVDTTAPETTITEGPPSPTNSTAATFSFTTAEDGGTFTCTLDEGGAAPCSPGVSYIAFADGEHTFSVVATDAAGNTDATPAIHTWTVDTIAPETTIAAGPPTLSNASGATFSLASNEAGSSFACSLDGGEYTSCEDQASYLGLPEGQHTFAVVATDGAGNSDQTAATHRWIVDTIAPETTITGSTPALTNAPTASFSFDSSELDSSFVCSLDGAELAACESPASYVGLKDGEHTFSVRAVDPAGNADPTPASRSFTVDTVAPETTIDTGPAPLTRATSATFTFSAGEGATFECSLDGELPTTCESGQTYASLADGVHGFEVRATDTAGNVDASPASSVWTVDTTPPQTTVASGPPAHTNDPTPTFELAASEDGSSFECSLDGTTWTSCDASHTTGPLADGDHTLAARATDPAGNTDLSPATYAFTVDTAAPETEVDSGPPPFTNDPTPSFTFAASESGSSFECSLDGVAWTACPQDYVTSELADDAHTLSVRATDLAGNTDASPATWAFTVDTVAPQTTIDSSPAPLTQATSATFTFSANEPATFQCAFDGVAFGACLDSYTGLGDGPHTFEVRATDAAGNTDPTPALYTWTVDTTPPQTTIASGPPAHTNDPTPSFELAASEDGSSFACSLDGADWSPCEASHTPGPLDDGAHLLLVQATDLAGNTDPTAETWSFTVDTVAPQTTIDAGPSGYATTASASFAFSADEAASFECSLDEDAFAPCGGTKAYEGVGEGAHTFSVRAVDLAGNADATPATRSFTVDTIPPETAIDSGPAPLTQATSATFAFSASEAGSSFACSLDGSAFGLCPASYSGLADGTHTFAARATDPAGNTDPTPATQTWTVDTVAPDTTLSSNLSDPGNVPTPEFTFTASESATFRCSVDGEPFATCVSPHTTAALAEGTHTFEVHATDAAGNVEAAPASLTFTIDLTAPETTITTAPPAGTTSTVAAFTFASSETGSTFECSLDGAALASCSSPVTHTVALGTHTFAVRATDAAGNVDATPASRTWTVEALDTTPPETTITSGPSGPTNETTPTFAFTASETGSTFQCSLDGAAFTTCSSPLTTAALADAAHTFAVRATDAAGNMDASPAARDFTVDTIAPDTSFTFGPSGLTGLAAASFGFTSTETGSSFECSLDGAAFTSCSSPVTTPPLTEASHTFAVRATDAAGNTDASAASRTFTVDVTAPDTTITSAPEPITSNTAASFSFTASEAGSTFQCSLDGAAYASCSSPVSYTVTAGPHTFSVHAADGVGNTDATPATHSWNVQSGDVTPPETTITAGPTGATTDSTPTWSFSASEAGSTFECSVDGGAYATCTSPFTTAVLADGPHTFGVRAVDAAGNADPTPASRSITVDTTAPDTTITSGPSGPTNDSTPTFAFASSETPSTFQCSVDTGSFTSCSSPFTTSTLSSGAHTFRVRAIDALGQVDATPATRSITIDTSAPSTAINSGPPSSTANPVATFTFSSTDTTATFECSLDTGAWAACVSPTSVTVTPGSQTYRVRARDAAGNVDATPATRTWTLTADTTPPNTTITSAPPATTTDLLATFAFTSSETGSSFECSLDSTGFLPCSSPASFAVAVGSHTFQVRAWDAAGNLDPTPASHSWTVVAPDSTPPETTITSGPSSPTTSTAASFTFTSSEAGSSFECSLDGAAFAACASPASYTVGIGSHTFQVRARDGAGNLDQSPASYPWTVEAPPPGTCAAGGTVTLGASADGWVLQSSPTSNYANDSVIKVDTKSGANARALVRFALPAIPSGCQVTSAQLRLYASSYKTGRTLQALALTGAWTETGVTWANQPAASGSAATVASGSGYLSWNVTSQLAAAYAGNTGFLVRDQTEDGAGIEQGFHSREKAPDNPPQLVLTFG